MVTSNKQPQSHVPLPPMTSDPQYRVTGTTAVNMDTQMLIIRKGLKDILFIESYT